jgi:glutathione synthase/RimK-type ligase-like ATP-grasp enzyme
VCFATCLEWPDISASDRLVARALEELGVEVREYPWNDPAQDLRGVDALVLRSNWDYHFAPDHFLAWLARLEATRASVWNPPALVRWNLSKRYLLDLAASGVPVVPTVILDDSPAQLPRLLAERGWSAAVVKPLVSASAHDTVLVPSAEAAAVSAAIDRGALRRPLMVQPFVEEIRSRGEWSLVFIDGAFTHAVIKRPAPDDFRVQPRHGGQAVGAAPPPLVVESAERALAALPLPPLYARIDGVEVGHEFQVMEVELNEPGLYFTHAPAAAARLATAIRRRLP